MTTFNKIVLKETEPENLNDLWFRVDNNNIPQSVWWYTTQGWKKFFDANTRYYTEWKFNNEASNTPITFTSNADDKNGVTEVVNNVYTYDASRELSDNANIVTEEGLKYHIDSIQAKLDALTNRVAQSEKDIKALKESLSTMTELLSDLNSRVSALETVE